MKVEKLISINQPKNWFQAITDECRDYPIGMFSHLNENSLIVDAGCNVGGFVNAFKNKFNKWVCIDASTYNIEQFKNNHPQFKGTIIHAALSSTSGNVAKLKKYTDENFKDTPSGNFGIVDFVYQHNNHGWKDNEYEEVVTVSFEDLLKFVGGSIDLLKIDIEGSEYDFLFNKDLRAIDCIVMELHNFLGPKKQELCNWIQQTHDEVCSINDGEILHFVKAWKRR